MPVQGYSSTSIRSELYDKLEELRKKLGCHSIAETIGTLVAIFPEYEVLKAEKQKQAPITRSR